MIIKKIVTIAMALSVSAFSVTGLAAEVATTTTYNTQSGKVEVNAAVSGADADSEITYIVKSGNEVVYIDQDTAEDGSVEFTYKIDKGKITGYSTSVKFGSSSETEAFEGNGTETLGIVPLSQAGNEEHYSIVYPGGETAWGYGEKVTAVAEPDSGYEITGIYIDGVLQDSESNTVELTYGQEISATVQEVVTQPGVNYILLETEDETVDGEVCKSRIAILKPQGNVSSIGVVYKGDYYASATTEMSAVKIIFPASETDYNLVGAYKTADDGDFVTGNPENIADSQN